MSVVDYLLFEQAISEGDMDALILLVKKSTTESQGKNLRALLENKLKQLKEKTGLTGNTFQEVVVDYKQRYLFDLYLNNLPLLIEVLESWLSQLLFQKLSSFGSELPFPDTFRIANLGRLAYILCLSNESSLELELLLSRLLKGDYSDHPEDKAEGFNGDDTTAFINLCLENKQPSFIRRLYFGRLACTESASFFQTVFCKEQTKEVYEEAAEVYFTYWRRHVFHKEYKTSHHKDLHYFGEKLKARGELSLLHAFLDRFQELIKENSLHPDSYREITRLLENKLRS